MCTIYYQQRATNLTATVYAGGKYVALNFHIHMKTFATRATCVVLSLVLPIVITNCDIISIVEFSFGKLYQCLQLCIPMEDLIYCVFIFAIRKPRKMLLSHTHASYQIIIIN